MAVLLRLAGYASRYRSKLALVYICLIGSTLLSLAIPRLLGITIDTALGSGDKGRLILLASVVLIISIIRGGFSYGQSYMAEYISQHVSYDLRHAFLGRLLSLSFDFHDRQKTGDLMSRVTTDVESIRWFVSFGLIYSIQILVLVGGVAGLMLTTDWPLALVALAAVPVAAAVAIRASRRFRRMWMRVQTETGVMTTVLQENLSGIRIVKTFSAEEREKEKFRGSANQVSEDTFLVSRLHAGNSSFLNLLFALVTAMVLWYGGRRVINAELSAGEITEFILYLGLLVFPIRMAGWSVNTFARAMAAGDRIFKVIDAPSSVQERRGASDIGQVKGEVAFEGVSFSYNPDSTDGAKEPVTVLRDINFKASPGQKVAIVGAPGSGKSTLVNLIPRFHDVSEGRITIDGTDIRNFKLSSLRLNVGIVFQDVFLFGATIRENIAYGVPDASLKQVQDAAISAQMHDFIMGLPDQYDTFIGERGVTLSGGQRQRVAIARALLLDPPILILDDSTSSVDIETETLIRKALDVLMAGRTTFVIANRVSSLRTADLILVMKDHQIAEAGTHQQLVKQGGLYRDIYELQLRAGQKLLEESPAES